MAAPTERGAALRAGLAERSGALRGNLTARRQRLQKGLLRDLSQALPVERPPRTLAREEPRGGIPSARGYSETNQQPGKGAGGVASPLIEGEAADADPESPDTPVLARESYDVQEIVSSDGLFVWEVTPPSKITFRDANGDKAEFLLANPYAVEEEEPP